MDSLCLFSFFSINYYTIQVVDFSGIRTRIWGKKVVYTDHLTQHHGPEIKHFDWMVQIMRRSTIFFQIREVKLHRNFRLHHWLLCWNTIRSCVTNPEQIGLTKTILFVVKTLPSHCLRIICYPIQTEIWICLICPLCLPWYFISWLSK